MGKRSQGFLFGLGPRQSCPEMGNTLGSAGAIFSVYFVCVTLKVLIRHEEEDLNWQGIYILLFGGEVGTGDTNLVALVCRCHLNLRN